VWRERPGLLKDISGLRGPRVAAGAAMGNRNPRPCTLPAATSPGYASPPIGRTGCGTSPARTADPRGGRAAFVNLTRIGERVFRRRLGRRGHQRPHAHSRPRVTGAHFLVRISFQGAGRARDRRAPRWRRCSKAASAHSTIACVLRRSLSAPPTAFIFGAESYDRELSNLRHSGRVGALYRRWLSKSI